MILVFLFFCFAAIKAGGRRLHTPAWCHHRSTKTLGAILHYLILHSVLFPDLSSVCFLFYVDWFPSCLCSPRSIPNCSITDPGPCSREPTFLECTARILYHQPSFYPSQWASGACIVTVTHIHTHGQLCTSKLPHQLSIGKRLVLSFDTLPALCDTSCQVSQGSQSFFFGSRTTIGVDIFGG